MQDAFADLHAGTRDLLSKTPRYWRSTVVASAVASRLEKMRNDSGQEAYRSVDIRLRLDRVTPKARVEMGALNCAFCRFLSPHSCRCRLRRATADGPSRRFVHGAHGLGGAIVEMPAANGRAGRPIRVAAAFDEHACGGHPCHVWGWYPNTGKNVVYVHERVRDLLKDGSDPRSVGVSMHAANCGGSASHARIK